MSWRAIDRALVLVATGTLAAVLIVGWLEPRGELDRRYCGMDASSYLATPAAWFFIVRWSWRGAKALSAAFEGLLADPTPPPDLQSLAPPKHDPA